MTTRFCSAAVALLVSLPAPGAVPAWVSEGPRVDRPSFSVDVPVDVLASMVLIDVEVGGKPRRFVFDTGSPSMMDAALADELGLEAIDRRQGHDAHGAVVDTRIVQADFDVGGVTFRKVPVFVAALPHTARCLFDGVLGSELLPLCAWQIDVQDRRLRCNPDVSQLAHVAGAAKLPLHDFGYPHAPILDVAFARNATSKALFDTGSPEYFAISPQDFEGARRNEGVERTIHGHGSIGGSAGGVAPDKDQLSVVLSSLSVGELALGAVRAPLREVSPSLVGASLLQHFVVTLDQRHAAAYFDRYRDGPFDRGSFGFGLAFEDGVRVSLVWDGSPAHQAGLRVGERLRSINGTETSSSCEGIRRAMRAVSESDRIVLERDDGAVALERHGASGD